MKKISTGKIFGIGVITLLGLGIIGFATLWIMFPPEKIKSLAVNEVGKVLGRKVMVEKAGVSIFPVLGVSLRGVEIANTTRPGFSEESFVKIDQFVVQIVFASLIKKQPEISKIIIKKPQIIVEIDSNGAWNYDDMAIMVKDSTVKKEKKSGGLPVLPVPLSLKMFVIENGTISYRDSRSGQEVVIGALNEKIKFTIDKKLEDITTSGELVLSKVSLKTKEIKKPLSNLTITLSHDIGANLVAGTANVKMLRLSLQKVFLNVVGTVTDLNTTPNYNLTLQSEDIAIEDLLREVPVELAPMITKLTAAGVLQLGVAVKGSVEEGAPLPVSGTLGLKDVMVKYTDLPKSLNSINAAISFTDNSISVTSFRMLFGENPVECKAHVVNFKKPQIDLSLRARVKLDDVKEMIVLPPGASLGGTMSVDVSAQGEADPANPQNLAINGKLDLIEVAALWPPLVIPAVINGGFSLSNKAIGEKLSVVIGQSSLSMNAAVSNYLTIVFPDSTKKLPRPTIDFSLASPLLNVDAFMPPAKKDPNELVKKEQERGVLLLAPLPGIDMQGTVTAQTIISNGLTMKNMKMQVKVVRDIADIAVTTGFAGGTIAETIHADLQNTKSVSINNKLAIQQLEVNDLMSILGGFIQPTNPLAKELKNIQQSLFGTIQLTSSLSARGGTAEALTQSLSGEIAAKVTNGKIANSLAVKKLSGVVEKFVKINDITFRDLSAQLKIANANVLVENLRILSMVGDWDANGAIGFDSKLALQVTNRLTKPMSDDLLKIQGGGKSVLKGLLKGSQYSGVVNNVIDNVGIPVDREGRITLKMALAGLASAPQASFIGFGAGEAGSAKSAASPKQQLTAKAKELIDQKKAVIEQKLTEEKQKVEEQLKSITQEQQPAVEAKKEQAKEVIKKGLGGKLKKIF